MTRERIKGLPAEYYQHEVPSRIFTHQWQFLSSHSELHSPPSFKVIDLLPGIINESLLLIRDRDGLRIMPNVCTHRGMHLLEGEGALGRRIICPYHGRNFNLDGRCVAQKGFEEVRDFPSERDNLISIPVSRWHDLIFACLEPEHSLTEAISPIVERVGHLPLNELQWVAEMSKTYHVKANWMLYVENYLEGLHIPFVHPGLNANLDKAAYGYEIFPRCNLQIGYAIDGSNSFNLPAGHPDEGKMVFAWYFFLVLKIWLNKRKLFCSCSVLKLSLTHRLVFSGERFATTKISPSDFSRL